MPHVHRTRPSAWFCKRGFDALAPAALLALSACGGGGTINVSVPVAPEACAVSATATTRAQRWQADIACADKTLMANHPAPGDRGGLPSYREYRDRLVQQIDTLSDAQMTVGLMATLAQLRDGHTSIYLNNAARLSLQLMRMSDGLVVTAAQPGMQTLLGRRITRVGGMPVEALRERAALLVPAENATTFAGREADLLTQIEVLAGLGARTALEGVVVEAEDSRGESVSLLVPSRVGSTWLTWPATQPLALQHAELNYWAQTSPSRSMLYVHYRRCVERDDLSMAAWVAQLREKLQATPVDRIVVDLRFNAGGSSALAQPLGELLMQWSQTHPGGLQLLVGPGTYSSALMNVLQWRNGARVIGEPPGENTDMTFGEVRSQRLPYSGLAFQFSTRRFQFLPERELPLTLRQAWSWAELAAGTDPVLEAALAR